VALSLNVSVPRGWDLSRLVGFSLLVGLKVAVGVGDVGRFYGMVVPVVSVLFYESYVFYSFRGGVAVIEGHLAHLARAFPGRTATMMVVAVQGPPKMGYDRFKP
jgi:hypothetical protein